MLTLLSERVWHGASQFPLPSGKSLHADANSITYAVY